MSQTPSDISARNLPNIVVTGPDAQGQDLTQQQPNQLHTKYLNREISWLRFNMRVLAEARNPANPLLERVRFLSISASNLEEFFMVRVAGINDQITRGAEAVSDDGQTAAQQLPQILKLARKMMDDQQECLTDLMHGLAHEKINLVAASELTPIEKKWVETFFLANVFPTLTPIAIDPAHPFPFLPNKSLTAIYTLEDEIGAARMTALILLPAKLPRFIRLSGQASRMIALEEVLDIFLPSFFPGYHAVESGFFQVLRDSDIAISDEAEDLMSHYEKALKSRKRGSVIGLILNKHMPATLRKFLTSSLRILHRNVFQLDGMIGLTDLNELAAIERPDLKFKPWVPRYPERVNDYGGDVFAAIRAKDLVVHHPYESFDVVMSFIRQAASDENVISIKQTLYRTSSNSPVVKALIEAAENGKSVTAVVELRARFDEEANIKLARDLERSGVQVIYGIINLKTHAKVTLVTRKEPEGLRSYAHFGTGNYNPVTSRVYTDLSLLTCDPELAQDAAKLFNYLTGYAKPDKFTNIIMAPIDMRHRLLDLIDAEVKNAEAGKPAGIWAKMNSLVDPEITDALYNASQKGVKIELVVRGICCLRPGVKGLSENIRVKSIVGRFLEHSRIFCFANGGDLPHSGAKVYIASADWMGRNLDTRVEVMVEIKNPTVHEQVLDQIMMANLLDDSQSWELQEDGAYKRIKASGKLMSAQDFFMKYPSYSGRGTAEHNPRLAEAKKSKRYNPHTDRKPRQKAQAQNNPPPEAKDKSGT
ncbi:MAG: RNA degradosome polyphosphate kinase [Alphaproteobacteria bacterium]|nr:MAG: RNA degradosome polyphosphate kinase [Alphaproteobacteria bacterium]